MYPRLVLARDLLKDEGVVFISTKAPSKRIEVEKR